MKRSQNGRDLRASEVLGLLASARLDLEASQLLVKWAVAVEHDDEEEVAEVLRHLALELYRLEGEREPKRRKGGVQLDVMLPVGTRFLTAWVLRGQEPVSVAGLAVGLAQGRGAKRMDRLETMLRALAPRPSMAPGSVEV